MNTAQAKASQGVLTRIEGVGESRLAGFVYAPESAATGAPVLVTVHGVSRDAHEQARAFQPMAETHGWLLVSPEFSNERHGDYQRLGRVGRGPRADHALDDLIDACCALHSLEGGPRFLSGYSAGGQFVHRYVMAHPDRVAAAAIGAAGWFTFPDPKGSYPYGLRVGGELPGVRLSPGAFLRTPMLVTVGSRDNERDPSLRQTARVDRLQGHDRLERAVRWTEAMNALARRRELPEPIRLQVLKGARHDFLESCSAGLLAATEAFFCEAAMDHKEHGTGEESGSPFTEETK